MTLDSRYGGRPIFEDKKLPCVDCGAWWLLTASEQREFYARDFKAPRRCPECRKINRTRKAGQ